MQETRKKRMSRFGCNHLIYLVAAVALSVAMTGIAAAFDLPVGREDIKLRWDNTVKYNLGIRAKSAASDLVNSPNYDDGDRNFKSGGVTTNRLDVLSELDFIFKEDYGFRVSAAGWYDQRYRDPMDNNSTLTSNTLEGGTAGNSQMLGFSDRVKKYTKGPYGEVLDAFVFGRFDVGPVPVNVKVGRHTLYWGEALLSPAALHGISYSQFPIDFSKALSVPGSEIKELFRPRGGVSIQAQLTTTLGLQIQQFFQFDAVRLPESGSYMAPADFYQKGGDALLLAPGFFFKHDSDIEPDGTKDFGIALNWKPDFLTPVQGKLGFYFRQFTDQMPQLIVDYTGGQYFLVYPDKIKLFGISSGFAVGGISIGIEYSYRQDMPLNSNSLSPAMMVFGTRPDKGETTGARGDVHMAVLNFMKLFGPTPLWQGGQGILEFTYCRWGRVSQNESVFKGSDSYAGIDRVTRNALGMAISMSPTWYAVWPQWDLSLPLSYNVGLLGDSAVNGGDNRGRGKRQLWRQRRL